MDLVELVDRHAPDCACESGMVSIQSRRDPVGDDEFLVRIVVAPKDASDQTLPVFQPGAIMPIIGSGLSVLREGKASGDEIERLAEQLVKGAARNVPVTEKVSVIGVLRFQAASIRIRRLLAGTELAAKPIYCIYETPMVGYPSHADVLIAATRFPSKTKRKTDAFGLFAELQSNFIRAADYNERLRAIAHMGEKST